MEKTYKIIRFFANDGRRDRKGNPFQWENEVRARGLTLEEAQAHCKDPETSSRTAKRGPAVSMTNARGSWFDGYEEETEEEQLDNELEELRSRRR